MSKFLRYCRSPINSVRCLVAYGAITLLLGCGGSYAGRFPKSGTHPDKVNYKMRSLPTATVIPVPDIDLDHAPDDPPLLQFPVDLKTRQAVAFEGLLNAPKTIADVFVRVEIHWWKTSKTEPILAETAVVAAKNENGIIEYRVELLLPATSGRHRVRIGVIIEDGDDEMVGIAHGEVVLKQADFRSGG